MSEVAAADGLISADMRALEGKVLNRRVSYPVSASDIRKWAIATHYPAPPPARYLGVGLAGGEQPLVAPEEFNPFAWGTPDGEPKPSDVSPGFLENQAGITPPPLEFIVNGGSFSEYGAEMREGDVITAEHRLQSYAVKQGKRGPMLITRTEDRWTNQNGEVVRISGLTLIRF